jgi:hypothetical protein
MFYGNDMQGRNAGMKNHVFMPLIVVLGIVALILIARVFLVPKDFGVGERGYMYGWHRAGNQEEWKNFKVKFMARVLQGLPFRQI